jgi:hypothetical protein
MSTTGKILRNCIGQLIITEGLSIWLFWRARALIPSPISTGLLAPWTLLVVPQAMAIQEGRHAGFALLLLVDVAFLAVMTFLIASNRKVESGLFLLLFNLSNIMFTAGGI